MDSEIATIIDKPDLIKQVAYNDPERAAEIINSVLTSGPKFVSSIQRGIAHLVAHPTLKFEKGVFSLTRKPDEKQIDDIVATITELHKSSSAAKNMSRWILGNIAAILDEANLPIENVLGQHDIPYNTLVTSRTTFQFFREKRYPMPFSHHKEIAYAADLSTAQKHAIAAYVAENKLTHTVTRRIIKAMQEDVRANKDVLEPKTYHELDPPPKRTQQYLVLIDGGHEVVDGRPDDRVFEKAEAVFQIRSVLKDTKPDGGGEG